MESGIVFIAWMPGLCVTAAFHLHSCYCVVNINRYNSNRLLNKWTLVAVTAFEAFTYMCQTPATAIDLRRRRWTCVRSSYNSQGWRIAGADIRPSLLYIGKKYCRYQYQSCCWHVLPLPILVLLWQYFSLFVTFATLIFSRSSVNEVDRIIVVEKMAKSL